VEGLSYVGKPCHKRQGGVYLFFSKIHIIYVVLLLGHLLRINTKMERGSMYVFNIYASSYSSKTRAESWKIHQELVVSGDWLLGGEFNMTLWQDRFPPNQHIISARKKEEWEGLIIKHSLTDIGKHYGFTWNNMRLDNDVRESKTCTIYLFDGGTWLGKWSIFVFVEGLISNHKMLLLTLIIAPPEFCNSSFFKLNTIHL